jgi:hypothetical protein
VSRKGLRSRAPWVLITLAAVALAGCGGDDEADKRFAAGSAGSADSPRPFVKRFERLTGVRLKLVTGDLLGIRLDVPAKPNRFVRFGAYQLVWTKDERQRKLFLGNGEPDDDGIYWRRVGASYSASKPFGDRLMLRWVGRRKKETTPQWERLERAVQAAFEGSLGPLPSEERPCRDEGLDPLRGRTGSCSVKGLPVTFVEADDELSGGALEARVLGFGYAEKITNPGVAPLRPRGRFLLVAYRVTNRSEAPINFLHPQLRMGGRSVAESPDAAAMLPRSRALPLPPDATLEARAAFDVDESADPRQAAFVLPIEREGRNDPSPLLAEGWIRLAEASPRLPRAPGARGARKPAA